ncbi:hypothetical protein EVAR_77599_1 [Eumeta japonica]|uniref:Uncharacterized protein n=1 Tax=Eumeta variegata TaxID=151549 RepID=A0A4C1T9P1_EUMVA|nr:hypothetical protein EVAR_77599_1 [Eumeta japonica]
MPFQSHHRYSINLLRVNPGFATVCGARLPLTVIFFARSCRSGGARRRRRQRPPTASRLKGPRKPDVADVHEWCSAATGHECKFFRRYNSMLFYFDAKKGKMRHRSHKRFQSGNFDVKDEPHSGQSITKKVNAILEKAEQDQF